ncbi:NUDIX hydrolase [Clostridium tarantellae]|uniref:NUDIX domain-containing protein n=1 Tax=Clostridium tarantellae TaxID=39493 RepID=A0A6I1MP08_9CLOT|nr:NUDIX hydrolase [Clostridium tarantellae]MPQ42641.1 NUDIX domain-containing protein [Clostridium tarantellae]
MKIEKINKLTNCRFLNLYKLELKNKENKKKEYFLASRRNEENLACKTKNHNFCDGVMIIPITTKGELVLIKQFRPAINDYIYEFPAGLVDKNESIEEAARRELFEETGLKCIKFEKILAPCYTSVGMSDETVAVVKMIVEGIPTNENIEENEEIEIITIKIEESKEFIKKHNMSIKTALVISFIF